MTQYSTSDLSRKWGTSSPKPCAGPSPLPSGTSRAWCCSASKTTAAYGQAHTPKAGRLETMPDDLFEDVKRAVGPYEREGDET